MNKKYLLILIGIFFITAIATMILTHRNSGPAPAAPQITEVPPVLPTGIPPLPAYTKNQNAVYSFSGQPAPAAGTVAAFTAGRKPYPDLGERLASKLGLNNPVRQEQAGPGGAATIWTGGTDSLTYYTASDAVSYSSVKPAGTLLTSNMLPDLKTAADDYFTSLDIPDITGRLAFSDYELLASVSGTPASWPPAYIIQMAYTYSENGIPVSSQALGSVPDVWLQMNAAGKVVRFYLTQLPLFTRGESVPVISPQTAVGELSAGGGTVSRLEFSDPSGPESILLAPPGRIRVRSAELGYFYTPGYPTLGIVYVVRGDGYVENQPVKTTSVIDAIRTTPE